MSTGRYSMSPGIDISCCCAAHPLRLGYYQSRSTKRLLSCCSVSTRLTVVFLITRRYALARY